MNKNSKKSKIIIAVSVVLVVAIIAVAIVLVLNKTSNPKGKNKDKKEEEIVFDKSTIVVANDKDLSFSVAEFNYFYYYVWQNIENTAYQYEYQYSQYNGAGAGVMMTGYDYTKSPASQEYKNDYSSFTGITLEDLKVTSATWADVMKYAAISQLVQTKYGAKMARAEGLSLTAEEQANIDAQIKELEDNAREQDFSTNRLLRKLYGNGVTEKLVRSILTEQTLADAYFKKYATDAENAITDQQILDKYNANPDDYSIVGLRAYPFEAEYEDGADDTTKETARKQAKALADAFLASATSEEDFIKLADAELKKKEETKDKDADSATALKAVYKDQIAQSISEEVANWAFSADRTAGESAVFPVGDDTFFVVMLTATKDKDTTASANDVRHILIKFPDAQTDADGKQIDLTDAQKAETLAKAEEVLAKYNENPTEENFVALTKEFTDDVDSNGNPNNDGLYEGVTASSNYVEAFKNWATAPERMPGDVEIVETEYGYHVMYYSKSQGETWKETIKQELLSKVSEDLIAKIDNEYINTINMNSNLLTDAFESQTKHIEERLIAMLGE